MQFGGCFKGIDIGLVLEVMQAQALRVKSLYEQANGHVAVNVFTILEFCSIAIHHVTLVVI